MERLVPLLFNYEPIGEADGECWGRYVAVPTTEVRIVSILITARDVATLRALGAKAPQWPRPHWVTDQDEWPKVEDPSVVDYHCGATLDVCAGDTVIAIVSWPRPSWWRRLWEWFVKPAHPQPMVGAKAKVFA